MKPRLGPTSWVALRCLAAVAALVPAAGSAWAVSAHGIAMATVIEPIQVNRLLGLPASALEIYLSQRGPAGPQTGSVLIRVIGGVGDQPVAVQRAQPSPVQAQGLVGGAVILDRGLAMAVMASMSDEEQGHDDKPVAITIAFN
ncbi:MAG: hypothetical protein JO006_18805 [Paucibacter sp.]|nr:hypothetical protein [Roseateles sp.]